MLREEAWDRFAAGLARPAYYRLCQQPDAEPGQAQAEYLGEKSRSQALIDRGRGKLPAARYMKPLITSKARADSLSAMFGLLWGEQKRPLLPFAYL